LAGQCERKFSVENQLLSRGKLSASIKKYLQMKAKIEQRKFYATIRLFLQQQNDNTLSQLTPTPPFPTPHVLAPFAYKA
jgi:hypothetical protein